jgi:broad specificity phosphatase PhoE
VAVETVIRTLRHAQTTYGADKRYAGTIDAPLSEKGERDCVAAAPGIAQISVDVVVTSTLTRARETARLLGFEPSRCAVWPLCDERNYGILEGHVWDEVPAMEPPVIFIEVGGESHSVNPLGGEPFEDVWQRAKEFRREILDQYAGLSVLVVSHSVFLQMFHGVLRGTSCIESLASYPASLELFTFRLSDGSLIEETDSELVAKAGVRF